MEDLRMKDIVRYYERLQFEEDDNKIDWFEIIKCGLFVTLFIGLFMLCFAPFMWK
jgi:hypothetical protein